MRLLKKIFLLLIPCVCTLFSSCGNDDDDAFDASGLIGVWQEAVVDDTLTPSMLVLSGNFYGLQTSASGDEVAFTWNADAETITMNTGIGNPETIYYRLIEHVLYLYDSKHDYEYQSYSIKYNRISY